MSKSDNISKKPENKEIMDIVNKSYSKYAENFVEKKEKQEITSLSCCPPEKQLISVDQLIQPTTIPSLGCDRGLLGIANPKEGEIVVDLGSGPGKDSITAAKMVGEKGKVIGVDFSDDMLELATKHAEEFRISNVEYRKGNLIDIPVDDNSVDLVISNCVINLVPDKEQVFKEVYRILKPGGRLVESDMVGLLPLGDEVAFEESTYCGCIGGAVSEDEYSEQMRNAGFSRIEMQRQYVTTVKINDQEIPYASSIFIGFKE